MVKIGRWHIIHDKTLKQIKQTAKDEQRALDAKIVQKVTHDNVILAHRVRKLEKR